MTGDADQRYWQRIDGRERENVAVGLPFQRPLPPPDSQAPGGNDAHPACTGQLNKPVSGLSFLRCLGGREGAGEQPQGLGPSFRPSTAVLTCTLRGGVMFNHPNPSASENERKLDGNSVRTASTNPEPRPTLAEQDVGTGLTQRP